jgi:hypothetical protein
MGAGIRVVLAKRQQFPLPGQQKLLTFAWECA